MVMTGGLAHVCLVTSHMTITRARIETNIPRKRAGSSDHRKAMARFYETVYQVSSLLATAVAGVGTRVRWRFCCRYWQRNGEDGLVGVVTRPLLTSPTGISCSWQNQQNFVGVFSLVFSAVN